VVVVEEEKDDGGTRKIDFGTKHKKHEFCRTKSKKHEFCRD
jgi:hypothetical protein